MTHMQAKLAWQLIRMGSAMESARTLLMFSMPGGGLQGPWLVTLSTRYRGLRSWMAKLAVSSRFCASCRTVGAKPTRRCGLGRSSFVSHLNTPSRSVFSAFQGDIAGNRDCMSMRLICPGNQQCQASQLLRHRRHW